MDPKRRHLHLPWFLLLLSTFLCKYTYSDVGKFTSSQNLFGNSAHSQFTTKNNTRVIAQKGGLAILPCVVKVNSPATVSWIRRKDFQLLTVGLSTHSSDKRFLVEHTRHMGHWSLRIKAVKEDDRGFYECQLSIYPTQSIFIELKIVEAVAEISSAPDLHIDETSTLRLECKLKRATENPSFVFWYHNNKMVNYDAQGGFLVTSTGNSMQTNLELNQPVPIAPSSEISKSRGYKLAANSNTVNGSVIPTRSTSQTESTDAGSVSPQNHQSSYLLTPSMSVLIIKEVHFHHAGNYTCAPSNARPASITVHVLRGEKPAAMQHANRSILDNENISNTSLSLNSVNGINSGTYCLYMPRSTLLIIISLLFLMAKISLDERISPLENK
ncbi:uncharacterized protein LOC115631104 [Scaptodrosophila lebanonensis]|uniref:Uncharacterized protein LOC115631104 n=1 Tax=Drosophila lebanonensis TaxID=7225 RepID=A0A6J2U5H6_DROLE|nr:uncharacterized protein LOC115631104 [Scaptodrosophila lebanonensis]XP_030383621.1 uncharacterized protein LOC115631104 [Scaptodrosophila lebanonensis]